MSDHTSGFLNLVTDLKDDIQQNDIHEIKRLLDSDPNIILIDVRETEEWEDGYLPNAIHLSKGLIERDIEKVVINKDSHIVLYCRGGYRSVIAAHNIQQMGYSNVRSMAGGITAWIAAGYEITED